MKPFLVLLLSSVSVLAFPVFAELSKGELAPDFNAQAALDGREFTYSLRESLAKGPVVIYFYPAAYTGGCNIQARTFAVKAEHFADAGASVIGVSLDGIERLKDFSADPEYCGGKVPVASDQSGEIATAYGVGINATYKDQPVAQLKNSRGEMIGHDMTDRTTFVVAPDGRIAATIANVSPKENVERALEVVEGLRDKP
ncbi:MAG: peroxiredoxin [Porticoccaceae bacterium]|nr:peroxiredoxin [Porticoccaceae bacterium]